MNRNILKIKNEDFAKVDIPQFIEKENKLKDWIEYGQDNQFPYYLTSLIAKSARHAAILKKKAMLIGGRGFVTTNLQTDTMMFLANSKNEFDMEEILAKIAYDLELFGGFALNIVWSKDRTKISEINYMDPAKIRIQIPDAEKGYPLVENYYVSDGFENTRKYPPVLYPGFSTIDRKKASQILYVKGHRAGTEYYAQPDYLPGIFWMELELKISQYHLASINNSFHPSFHLNWPIGNNMSDEEMDTLTARLKAQFQGAINTGEVIISFQENEMAPTITPIKENESDKRFITLDNIIEKGIMHSHRVNNPELFGIMQAGKLGDNNGDRVQSMQEFEIDYVIPQQQIIEKVLNRLARINGINDRIMINRYTDAYKKVGSDSVQDVLSVISNQDISAEQKYHLLVSLNYTHQVASNLSNYHEGNNMKIKKNVVDTGTTETTTTIQNK